MFASLIIPTYNKLPRLKLVLASIIKQTMPTRGYEVIVVDDCSSEETADYLHSRQWPINLRYIRSNENLGRSGARNVGIDNSLGDVLIFTDDDCLLAPDFVSNHMECFNRGYVSHGAIWNLPYVKFFEDPSSGELYPKYKGRRVKHLTDMCVSEDDVLERIDAIDASSRKTEFEKKIEKWLNSGSASFHWFSCTGGNIAVDAASVKTVGSFDRELGREWGMEDIELGYRLYKSGLKFQYVHDAKVFHLAHYRFNSDDLSHKAIAYFKRKHSGFDDIDLFESIVQGGIYNYG